MKKEDLKAALKPLIKECIKEVIFEDGVLSSVIQEVVKGTSAQVVTEVSREVAPAPSRSQRVSAGRPDPAVALQERKKKLLDSIGSEAFNGVNIFEDTTPSRAQKEQKAGSVDLGDPNDAGVDIGDLFAASGQAWNTLSKGMKK